MQEVFADTATFGLLSTPGGKLISISLRVGTSWPRDSHSRIPCRLNRISWTRLYNKYVGTDCSLVEFRLSLVAIF